MLSAQHSLEEPNRDVSVSLGASIRNFVASFFRQAGLVLWHAGWHIGVLATWIDIMGRAALAATDQGLSFTLDQLVALGRWVAIRLRWPALATALDEEPKLLRNLEARANSAALPNDAPTKKLLEEWHRWFEEEPALTNTLREPNVDRRMARIPFEAFLPVA